MERPLLTVIAAALISLILVIYTIVFLSPENFLDRWFFIILSAIFLTTALTTLLYFLRKKLNGNTVEKPKIKVRKILLFSFTFSLLPSLYLSLKILNALNAVNVTLLIILIVSALLYVLRNNQ